MKTNFTRLKLKNLSKLFIILSLCSSLSYAQNEVVDGNLTVIGNNCIGQDCLDSIDFGFDTIILRENNVRILFDDTSSSSSFPSNDWELIANDINNGGENYFALRDSTNQTIPFRIDAGAMNNILRITANNSIGIASQNINQFASLDLGATDKGLIINRLTTTQRTSFGSNLGTTENGLLVYDIHESMTYQWNGTEWRLFGVNTDEQELSLTGTTLGISGSISTVDLSVVQDGTGTDDQDLTSATLSGNNLTIDIEGGNSVTVDLSPILSTLTTQNTNQQSQIDDLLSRVSTIEVCACGGTLSSPEFTGTNRNNSILYQNIPNPFNGTTSIKYYIPNNKNNGAIVFSNNSGQIIDNIKLENFGEQELFFNSDSLASGIYYYTLFVDGRKVDSKKMIVE